MSLFWAGPTAQMLCQEAAPESSWHGYSAPVPRVPGKRHPAMGFLHESIPHGQSIPSHIHAHTCNKEINQIKASKHELERGKHIGTVYIQGNFYLGVPSRGCGAKTVLLHTGGEQRSICLVAKGFSGVCLEISAQRKREMLLADKYFTCGHKFQLGPGIKSSQDIFLIKQRGFLSSV